GGRHPFLAQGIINYLLSEDPHMPLTGGLMRPVRTTAPRGTVVNPELPAAVGVRYATVIRLYNVVLGALAQAVPVRVPAAGAGQGARSEEHTSELQSRENLVCRLLLEKKKRC